MKNLFICSFLFVAVLLHPGRHLEAGEVDISVKNNQDVSVGTKQEAVTVEVKDWYAKFLKGTLLVDGWNDVTKKILAKTNEKDRENRRTAMKKLGEKIGWEWAKDNDIRKIDTEMLKKWGSYLKKTADDNPAKLAEVIAEINKEVDALLMEPSAGVVSSE